MCNVQRLRPCRLIGASLLSYIVQFTLFLLGFDGEGGVGDGAEAVLGDELAGDAADAVGLVVNARQGALQFLYELLLAGHEALDLGTLGVRRALVEDVVELAAGVGAVRGLVAVELLEQGVVFFPGLGQLMRMRNSSSSSSEYLLGLSLSIYYLH